jgi:nucleoside phosphorylase
MRRPDEQSDTDLVIAAAHPLELSGFHAVLGPELRAELHGLWVTAVGVGVGMAEAGGGTARVLATNRPRALLLVGSCGVYPGKQLATGQLFVPTRVLGLDSAVLAGRAAFPEPMTVVVEPHATLSHALASAHVGISRGALGVTFGITTDDALARELAQASGSDAENLEALAVGLACQTARVAFGAVLGCTNEVGSQGRKQWQEHHALAARMTSELVLSWIARGAPGLPTQ